MSVDRQHNGSYVFSEIVNGYMVTMTYYGYTLQQATVLFNRYKKTKEG